MRHLGSLVLSLVLAPLIWVLTGIGLVDFSAHLSSGDSLGTDGLLGLTALTGAGVLLAVLLLSRLSPLGVGLAGLVFIGMCLWAALDASSLIDTMPESVLGRAGALTIPAGGPGLLMGVPLVLTVLVPRRWRKHDHVTALYAATPGAPPPGTPYGQPPYGGPQPTPGFGPYPTSPGSPAYPGAPASGPGYATPGYGGGAPAYAAPGSPVQPAQSFAAPTSGPPAAPVTSAPPATSAPPYTPYYGQDDAATTRLSPPPPGSSPAAPPGYRPPSAAASDDATTRLPQPPAANGDEPTQLVDDGGMTKSLRGTPPPPAAYPPPGHSTPTPPPTDPDATRQM